MKKDIRFSIQLFAGLFFLVLAVMTSTRTGETQSKKTVEIAYEGQLIGENNKPIAGVFPLEFALYRGENDKKAIWREKHWIAVVDGRYNLSLGETRPLRTSLARAGEEVFLSISLQDGGELTREPLRFPSVDDGKEKTPKTTPPKTTKPTPPTPAQKTPPPKPPSDAVDYAKRAGVAEDAQKLGGKTLEQLEEELDEALAQLEAHKNDKRAHASAATTLSGSPTVLPRAGGKGGAAFVRQCPPGHVVTGIRGTAGQLIDSIQVVCTPLQ